MKIASIENFWHVCGAGLFPAVKSAVQRDALNVLV